VKYEEGVVMKLRMVNVTGRRLDPQLEHAVGLGKGFRPTPKPISNEVLQREVKDFQRRLTNVAAFGDEDTALEMYIPTNGEAWIEDPVLANAVHEMHIVLEQELTVRLKEEIKRPHPHNTNPQQRSVFRKIHAGDYGVCFMGADKEKAMVVVTKEQLKAMEENELAKVAYTPAVDCGELPGPPQDTELHRFTLNRVAQEGEKLVKEAKEKQLISGDVAKWCLHTMQRRQIARLRLLAKTHKVVKPGFEIPLRIRAVIDTTDFVTRNASVFLARLLKESVSKIRSHIRDSIHAVNIIEHTAVGHGAYLGTYDVVDFFPSSDQLECREAMLEALRAEGRDPEFLNFVGRLDKWIMSNIYFKTLQDKKYKMDNGVSIGLCHAREVTDLEWAKRELWRDDKMKRLQPPPLTVDIRMVDDGFFVFEGSKRQFGTFLELLQQMDARRQLTLSWSQHSIDFLDLTIYKGARLWNEKVLDLKLYEKPSALGLHLVRSSHHPQCSHV